MKNLSLVAYHSSGAELSNENTLDILEGPLPTDIKLNNLYLKYMEISQLCFPCPRRSHPSEYQTYATPWQRADTGIRTRHLWKKKKKNKQRKQCNTMCFNSNAIYYNCFQVPDCLPSLNKFYYP